MTNLTAPDLSDHLPRRAKNDRLKRRAAPPRTLPDEVRTAGEEVVVQATLIATPAFELTVDIDPTPYGYSLSLSSFVPCARRPDVHRRLQATISHDGLLALRSVINDLLNAGEDSQFVPPKRVTTVFPKGTGPTAASLWAYHKSQARQQKLNALQRVANGEQQLSLNELKSLVSVIGESLSLHASKESE